MELISMETITFCMDRTRFKSLWNGAAMIIFFAGIFLLNNQILGYSTFGIAIFMWIIGGIVTKIIFGAKSSKRSQQSSRPTKKTTKKPVDTCPACGTEVIADSQYCSECGASLETAAK